MVNIYRLTSTRDVTNIKYVGKTIKDLKIRLNQHKSGSCGQHTKNWINKELKEGYDIIITLIETVDDNVWEEKERFWIMYYLNMGYKLCNIQSGGNMHGGKPNEEKTKKCINNIRKNLYEKIEKDSKKVLQVNRKGKIVQEYKNIIQASGMTGISFDKIYNCCERQAVGEDCHLYSLRFIYADSKFIKRKFTDSEIRKEIEDYLFYKNKL